MDSERLISVIRQGEGRGKGGGEKGGERQGENGGEIGGDRGEGGEDDTGTGLDVLPFRCRIPIDEDSVLV